MIFHPYLSADDCFPAVIFAPAGEVSTHKILTAKLERHENGKMAFLVFDISDGQHLVNLLMLGKDMTLHVLREMPNFEWLKAAMMEEKPLPDCDASIAYLGLPNDRTFAREYEALRDALLAS